MCAGEFQMFPFEKKTLGNVVWLILTAKFNNWQAALAFTSTVSIASVCVCVEEGEQRATDDLEPAESLSVV